MTVTDAGSGRPGRKTRKPRAPLIRRRPWNEGWRELVTPEGVDLRLRIGAFSERCAAFVIDVAIMLAGLIVVSLLLALVAWRTKWAFTGDAALILWLLGSFLLRNFYFIGFELRAGAATPGKRALGLRVAARDGGRLTANAVFARNALRELEVFLPASFLFASGMGVDAGLIALGGIWSGVFVLFPLFNHDRLRLGDLAAGTMVVKAPRRVLRPDLAGPAVGAAIGPTFSEAQLDAYGIKELHALEEVLRRGERKTVAQVAERIRKKIGWEGPLDLSDRAFLNAYYAALRARLETRLLFGHRKADKFDRGGTPQA
ncbi:RDD family protein [Phenylobacterium sp.]|uniref:RDD family protein n=1 Tax=Phenylobacterium sp. TaxID=1871053 RepID=UPI002F422000